MIITDDFFDKYDCCSKIIQFLLENQKDQTIKIDNKDLFDWLNENITRLITKKQCIKYAVYAAEIVLPIFEEKYPEDDRPRLAIESAKKCILDPSEENKKKASSAASAAYSAAYAVRTAASYSAHAAYSADAASYSAHAAYSAASDFSKQKEIEDKIIKFGLELLLEGAEK